MYPVLALDIHKEPTKWTIETFLYCQNEHWSATSTKWFPCYVLPYFRLTGKDIVKNIVPPFSPGNTINLYYTQCVYRKLRKYNIFAFHSLFCISSGTEIPRKMRIRTMQIRLMQFCRRFQISTCIDWCRFTLH